LERRLADLMQRLEEARGGNEEKTRLLKEKEVEITNKER